EEAEVAERARSLGIPAEVLDRTQTAAKEPALEMNVAGAVYFPMDCHLAPQSLVAMLREKLQQMGVSFQWGAQFQSWKLSRRRVTGIRTLCGDFDAEEY